LYYLNTRYYDYNIGRFVNVDNANLITATPFGLTDKNLYAYCDNNPVMRVDYSGQIWNFIIGGIVGAVAGGVVATLNGGDIAEIVIGSLAGAASGVVAASGLGLLAQAGMSAGISAVADIANQTVDIVQDGGRSIADYNIKQTITESALGFVSATVGTVIGNAFDKTVTKNLVKSNKLFDQHLLKSFSAGLRKEAGRSSSSLTRQAINCLKRSNFYLNVYRGASSVIGSIVSFWNTAR
jgi:RHS repeat-associated protein